MNEATQQYVRQHADEDVRQLALRGCKDPQVDLTMALQQIQGWQTARRKLPTWATVDGLVYPPHLNMEQCSSEQTARYKASLCRRLLTPHSSLHTPLSSLHTPLSSLPSPHSSLHTPLSSLPSPHSSLHTLADLTGGFGVDFSFMSQAFDKAIYVERNAQLFEVSSANLRLLDGRESVHFVQADGVDFLQTLSHVTMLFLDPARRDDHGGRTYGIGDCTPDVLAIKDQLLQKADYVLLKLSPMLDWRKAVSDLGQQNVREVHLVAVGGECKELLVLLSSVGASMRLYCVNDDSSFIVDSTDAASSASASIPLCASPMDATPVFADPVVGDMLYEPNAAVMKAGCFAELALRYGVHPIAPNSHLFVSQGAQEAFPGRCFRICATSSMNRRDLKSALSGVRQANITVRNFPLSVAELRKRLKISDGGHTYIFATTLANGNHVLLLCEK